MILKSIKMQYTFSSYKRSQIGFPIAYIEKQAK